jgi:hypothetical protein
MVLQKLIITEEIQAIHATIQTIYNITNNLLKATTYLFRRISSSHSLLLLFNFIIYALVLANCSTKWYAYHNQMIFFLHIDRVV